MAEIMHLKTLDDPALAVFARLTEAQLRIGANAVLYGDISTREGAFCHVRP